MFGFLVFSTYSYKINFVKIFDEIIIKKVINYWVLFSILLKWFSIRRLEFVYFIFC